MTWTEELNDGWMDKHGLVSPYPVTDHNADYVSGNGFYYSGFYWEQEPDFEWLREIQSAIRESRISVGVYRRGVNHPDVCSFDDWIGIGILSKLAAIDILSNIKTFLQPQVRCHLIWCAGENPGFFYKLWWILALWLGSLGSISNQDNWARAWLLTRIAEMRGGKWVNWMIQKWRDTYRKKCALAGLDPNGLFLRCVSSGHPLGMNFKF